VEALADREQVKKAVSLPIEAEDIAAEDQSQYVA
jgi:hypothetical protein